LESSDQGIARRASLPAYFFFAYAFVNFFIFILQASPGTNHKGQNPAIEWRGFSGHWMVFYCASFVILSSALRSSRQRPDLPRLRSVFYAPDAFAEAAGFDFPLSFRGCRSLRSKGCGF